MLILTVYAVAFAHLNFQTYFTLLEVKWVLSGPSLKGYKGKNKTITFELYRKRKCQLIVFETEAPRLSKYLIVHRRQN